jgi:hypothetical protein
MFGMTVEAPDAGNAVPPPKPSEIEFVAYAEDCLLTGYIRLGAARLSDLLNDHEEFELVDVHVESLVGEHALEVTDVVVRRDELLLVQAIGPRGDRARRVRTRQHPLEMQVGPYAVRGYLHALPGSDPVASFARRRVMVPLTDASIEYRAGGRWQHRAAATLVVNRHQVEWVVESVDDEAEMPDVSLHPAVGPLAKDFTGYAERPSTDSR